MAMKCSTKEAMMVLKTGQCLPSHEVDPAAKLTVAAIAMRKSEWWWQVPDQHPDDYRGSMRKANGIQCDSNTLNGEIPWR